MLQDATHAVMDNAGHIAAGAGVGTTLAVHLLALQPYLSEVATLISIVSGCFAIVWYAERIFRRWRGEEPPP